MQGPASPSQSSSSASGRSNRENTDRFSVWSWVAGVLVALLIFRFPRRGLGADLDDSWRMVLNYAHTQGWQFGSDVVFTYGPLGFLANSKVAPTLMGMTIGFQAVMCLGAGIGLCRLAARMQWFSRLLLPGLFVLLTATNQDSRADIFFDTILICWGLLCWLETGPPLALDVVCLTGFAIIGAMTKFTWLMTSGLTVGTVIGNLWLRGERKTAFGMFLGLCLGFPAGWCLAGQKLSGLPLFVKTSQLLARDWNAMALFRIGLHQSGLHGGLQLMWGIFGLGIFTVLVAALRTRFDHDRNAFPRRLLLFFWLAGLMFVQWKHSVVRADEGHVLMLLTGVPIVVLSFEAFRGYNDPFSALLARAAGLFCVSCSVFLIQHFSGDGFIKRSVAKTYSWTCVNIKFMLRPGDYQARCAAAIKEQNDACQLPALAKIIGRHTVDVFGSGQSFAIFNQLNYHPQPIFQSYAALNRPLAELNDQFYASTNAPDFVLFRLQPIDERFVSMENSLVLRRLLINYDFVACEKIFILLRHARSEVPRLTLLDEGEVKPGQAIEVARFNQFNLWLEMDVEPSRLGRCLQFLYKLSPPQLCVQSGGASSNLVRYVAPSSLFAPGFLASPIVLDNENVTNLYFGIPPVRPAAYSIELPAGSERLWQETIRFKLFRIENPLPANPPKP